MHKKMIGMSVEHFCEKLRFATVTVEVDHPYIARALALLDRVGDAAADALIAGTAAVVPADSPTVSMIDAALDCGEGASLHEMIPAAIAAGRLDREGGR